jgi:hypothetical protein
MHLLDKINSKDKKTDKFLESGYQTSTATNQPTTK